MFPPEVEEAVKLYWRVLPSNVQEHIKRLTPPSKEKIRREIREYLSGVEREDFLQAVEDIERATAPFSGYWDNPQRVLRDYCEGYRKRHIQRQKVARERELAAEAKQQQSWWKEQPSMWSEVLERERQAEEGRKRHEKQLPPSDRINPGESDD